MKSPDTGQLLADGAFVQRDGLIVEVGAYSELKRRNPEIPEFGSSRHIVLPGLINAHHHGGLSNWLLGCTDGPLELWLSELWTRRDVCPYLDTMWGCLHLMRSGVTTVMHNFVRWIPPGGDALASDAAHILRAYADAGLRVAFSVAMKEQCRIVYGDDSQFLASLPRDVATALAASLGGASLSAQDYLALFEHLLGAYGGNEAARVRLLLSPSNVHWCSDRLLGDIKQCAAKFGAGIHMHLDETQYQHAWAVRTLGRTPTAHLHQLSFLGPELSCAHAVWLTEEDLDLLAAAGVTVCHNASSNLRLGSGAANVHAMVRRGIPVALGVDSNGLNDDHDMLQEIRLVSLLQRRLGHEPSGPTSGQVMRMATETGAIACRFAGVGTLEAGRRADAVLIDLDRVAAPAAAPDDHNQLDFLLQRAKPAHVDTVMVDGEIVLLGGKPTRFDEDALESELRSLLARPLTPAERERREIALALRPYIRSFYSRWL